MPDEISNLKKLEVLYLNGCSFYEEDRQRVIDLLPGCGISYEDQVSKDQV